MYRTLIKKTTEAVTGHVASARGRDPATGGVSTVEILATWPGVHAVLAYRLARRLQLAGVPLLPLVISYLSRSVTGIEIHPGAKIGSGFFIDHGSGVVVGETAEIGANVTIYQGVTLGGTGFQTGKRHPTVEDNVTIGSGAKLLGPITVGHGAKIGANSVVVEDVPPRSTVVGNPGHPVKVEGRRVEGPDADWIHLPDPLQDAVKSLSARIKELEKQVAELSGHDDPGESPPEPRPRKGRSSAGG
ncbi:MAG: serine O-acetyltransferase EpsC [Solirubrobacterales bacterium]